MKWKKVSLGRKLFIVGITVFLCSILMLILGVGMFASSGDYSRFLMKLGEFCFIFWIPLIVIGIALILVSIFISGTKKNTK